MKRILVLILALALLCTCFSGCAGSSADGKNEKYKIGMLSPVVTQGWASGVTYYAEKRLKELTISNEIEYRLIRCDSAEDMISGIDDLRQWGVQAVVVYPQWEGVESPIQELIDDGIPVVSFDTSLDCAGIYRVSGDNEDMGRQSAQYVVDKIGNTGRIVLLNSPAMGSVSTLRQKGFEEKIAEIAPNMTFYTYAAEFTREDGERAFAEALSNHSEIDAVFSLDDETSIGVLNALKKSGRTDVQVITGGGGCQEYLKLIADEENEGIHLQTAFYNPAMVRDAIGNALAILKGQRVSQVDLIPTTVVDKANCSKYLDENSPY